MCYSTKGSGNILSLTIQTTIEYGGDSIIFANNNKLVQKKADHIGKKLIGVIIGYIIG